MIDPIITAIAAYQAEMARYNTLASGDLTSDEYDALANETYATPLEVLESWDQPAITKSGALCALKFALDEGLEFSASDVIPAMIKAALAYFKTEEQEQIKAA